MPYKDSFLLVGGSDGSARYKDTIYYFNPDTSVFELLEPRLKTGRYSLVAMFVDAESFPECS